MDCLPNTCKTTVIIIIILTQCKTPFFLMTRFNKEACLIIEEAISCFKGEVTITVSEVAGTGEKTLAEIGKPNSYVAGRNT